MKISRELKTGIVAILIIILFVWGYNFLKDRSLTDKTRIFYAEYENVQGLIPTSMITINGLKVGKVSDITFHPTKPGILVVHMELKNEIEFTKNSVAQIYSPDFISGKSIKIELVEDNTEIAQNQDTLIGIVDEGILGMLNEQIAPLQSKVESFVVDTDSVMMNINKILDAKNRENIAESLQRLKASLSRLNNITKSVDGLLDSNEEKFDSILANADITMRNFSQISDSLKKSDLPQTFAKLQTSLSGLSAMIDSIQGGSGNAGKLLTDEELYDNLTGASKELEELLREFKEHPKRFVHFSVFGKKEKSYQETPSEN
ncbi:MAG: MlaD family protein [Bacteroidota bacterium]